MPARTNWKAHNAHYSLLSDWLPRGVRGRLGRQGLQRFFQEGQDAAGRFGRGIERQPQHSGGRKLRPFDR